MDTQKRWQDRVNLALGIWLLVSPMVLGLYSPEAIGIVVQHSFLMGALVIIIAAAALYRFYIWEEWISLAVGCWLIISPFVLGFTGETIATLNHIIVGLLVGADALWVMLQKPPMQKAA